MLFYLAAAGLFLGFSIAAVAISNFLKIKDLIRGMNNPFAGGSFQFEPLIEWLKGSIVGLTAVVLAVSIIMIMLSAIQSAGIGRMFARAVTQGKTGLRDYFEGIGSFTGRMFSVALLKGGIILLPVLAVLIFALIVALAVPGEAALPILIVILALGGLVSLAAAAAVSFFTWMWKPAIFIRGIGTNAGLVEGFRFSVRRFGILLMLIGLWLIFSMIVSMPSTVFQIIMQSGARGGSHFSAYIMLMMALAFMALNLVIVVISMFGRVFFVLLYYKVYAEEWQYINEAPAGFAAAYPPVQGQYQNQYPPAPVPPGQSYITGAAVVADPQSLASLQPEDIYTPEREDAPHEEPPGGDAGRPDPV